MNDKPRKVLICHSRSKLGEAQDLKHTLESAGDTVHLLAVDSTECTQEHINTEIVWADVVMFLLDEEFNKSQAASAAGGLAIQLGKGIAGVWCKGNERQAIPDFLDDYSDTVVENVPELVVNAVSGEIRETHEPGGNVRPPRKLKRHTCNDN